MNPPDLSLYIHFPWCERKCPYCDFNSHAAEGNLPEKNYIQCLIQDLQHDIQYVNNRPITSIFLGGGTPSLFSPASLHTLLTHIRDNLQLQPDCEITLEANPGTVEQGRFSGYREAGINRLSIGIQSLDDGQLKALGRIHNANDAKVAVQQARIAGFDNINLDMMYGLPEQTTQSALDDLQQLIDLEPEHISWYQLTLEPNTVFYSQPPALPDDDLRADISDAGIDRLTQHGFQRYEVSAFSHQQKQSRHNLNYWHFGDYLGLGAGAHGKVTHPDGDIRRYQKHRQPDGYLNSINPVAKIHTIGKADLPMEFMMNALRLVNGVELSRYTETTGLSKAPLQPIIEQLCEKGLLSCTPSKIKPTAKGLLFLNDVVACFNESA